MFAPHILHASEGDCGELNVEQELEFENRSINDIYIKLRVAIERLVASQKAKKETNPEPPVLVEPDVLEEQSQR